MRDGEQVLTLEQQSMLDLQKLGIVDKLIGRYVWTDRGADECTWGF